MRQCWLDNPADRPSFTGLRIQIEQLLSRDRNYLELENIDVPVSSSDSSSLPKESENDTVSLLTTTRPMSHQPTSNWPKLQPSPGRPYSQGGSGQFMPNSGRATAKSVTINLPGQDVNICMDKATDWLIRTRHEDNST